MRIRCSLCGMEFDDEDPLASRRKARHESWHDPPPSPYRRNMIRGAVVWEPQGGVKK